MKRKLIEVTLEFKHRKEARTFEKTQGFLNHSRT